MANTKHEDAIMKMGFGYFRDTILRLLGIEYEFAEIGPTELVELTIHSMYMDFTFLTTDDRYIHNEFQTTDGGEDDLRRFHAYEAVYSNKTGKQVITYVIYSGGIQHVKEELDCGLYTYRIHPIYMKEFNAGQIFCRLHEKLETGEAFTEEDFAGLTLTPLMAGGYGKKDAIKEAIQLAKVSQEEAAQKSIAMLYVLADKFLKGPELEEIKEVVAMTRLGQMLMEDGIEKGMQEGIQKGIQKGLERGRKEGLQEGLREGIHEGTEQMAALMGKLLEEDRMDDLKQAAKDKEYREKLLKEMKIIVDLSENL